MDLHVNYKSLTSVIMHIAIGVNDGIENILGLSNCEASVLHILVGRAHHAMTCDLQPGG